MKVGLPGFEDHIELLAALELRNQIFTIRHVQASPRDRITVSVLRKFIIQTRRGDIQFSSMLCKRGFSMDTNTTSSSSWNIGVYEPCNIQATSYLHIESNRNRGFKIYLVSTYYNFFRNRNKQTSLAVVMT